MTTTKKESTTKEPVFTLEQYAQRHKVNPGTIASFRFEASKDTKGLAPRTKDAWKKAIEAQTKKVYK